MSNNMERILDIQNDKGTEAQDKRTDASGNKRNNGDSLICSEGFLLLLGLIAIAVDPLFFYVPMTKNSSTCLALDKTLMIVAIILRTLVDILHDWSWWSKSDFRITKKSLMDRLVNFLKQLREKTKNLPKWLNGAYDKCQSPAADGSCELLGFRNLLRWFKNFLILSLEGRLTTEARVMAIIASLPLPQVVVLTADLQSHLTIWIQLGVSFQFIPRILRTYPTYVTASLRSNKHAWIGAAFNLLLFVLTGHGLGGFWYLSAVSRKMDCMKKACRGRLGCSESSLYCQSGNSADNRFLSDICAAQPTSNGTTPFDYGMYKDAIESNLIGSTNFSRRLFESFWWGISNLSSSGQNIEIGDYLWDACFAISVCLLGLFLFALLIGNLQIYLQSTASKMENLKEKRVKLRIWVPFSCLPNHLKEEVYRCRHPDWLKVSEVNLESFLSNIPMTLKNKLMPYFCENLFSKVKEFEALDPLIIQERAMPVVFPVGTNIYQEGHPMYRMIHIVRGKVSAYNVQERSPPVEFKKEDCLGKELLQAILYPDSHLIKAPRATKTFHSETKVEAFALSRDDCVAISKEYRKTSNAFREEWASRMITAAFRRKAALRKQEKSTNK